MMSSPPSLATTCSLRAGRLDHLNLGLRPVVGDDEVLRPDAIDGGRPSLAAGAAASGSRTPFGALEASAPLARMRAR